MKSPKPKFKLWFRGIALVTLFFFVSTSVVQADVAQVLTSEAAAPDTASSIKESIQSVLDTINLPENVGQVKRSFQGSRDRVVVHIQDAHVNEDAQRNIAKIIDYLAKNHHLKLVNVEGAEGDLYTKLFSFVPYEQVRREVADYFLKEGRLSASEYAAIVDHPELKLFGVENSKLYQENRRAYLEALSFKSRDEEILTRLDKILKDASRFVFSDEMRELLRRRRGFQDEGRELIAYVGFLIETAKVKNIAVHDYPRVHSLLSLVELEKQIDFEKAETEVKTLTDDLKNILSRERLTRFLDNSVQFQMKKMHRSAYYGYLENEIKGLPQQADNRSDLQKKYENVLNYLRYIRLYDSVDLEVFDEIQKLESSIKNKLFRTPEEVKLDQLIRIHDVYGKMFDFSLTKQDVDFFYQYLNDFKSATFKEFLKPIFQKYHFSYDLPKGMEALDEDLPKVEKFYQAALQRDPVLIQNAVDKMEKEGEKISVLVTGGFHTPGIEEYLREHDYSYLVIMPKISSAIDAQKDNARYQAAMQHKPMSIEKTLSDAFFAPKSPKVNDPRFQLAVDLMTPTIEMAAAKTFTDNSAEAMLHLSVIDALATVQNNATVREAFTTSIDVNILPRDREFMTSLTTGIIDNSIVELKSQKSSAVFVYETIPGKSQVRIFEINPTEKGVSGETQRPGAVTIPLGGQYFTSVLVGADQLPPYMQQVAQLQDPKTNAALAQTAQMKALEAKTAEIRERIEASLNDLAAYELAARSGEPTREIVTRIKENQKFLSGALNDLTKAGTASSSEILALRSQLREGIEEYFKTAEQTRETVKKLKEIKPAAKDVPVETQSIESGEIATVEIAATEKKSFWQRIVSGPVKAMIHSIVMFTALSGPMGGAAQAIPPQAVAVKPFASASLESQLTEMFKEMSGRSIDEKLLREIVRDVQDNPLPMPTIKHATPADLEAFIADPLRRENLVKAWKEISETMGLPLEKKGDKDAYTALDGATKFLAPLMMIHEITGHTVTRKGKTFDFEQVFLKHFVESVKANKEWLNFEKKLTHHDLQRAILFNRALYYMDQNTLHAIRIARILDEAEKGMPHSKTPKNLAMVNASLQELKKTTPSDFASALPLSNFEQKQALNDLNKKINSFLNKKLSLEQLKKDIPAIENYKQNDAPPEELKPSMGVMSISDGVQLNKHFTETDFVSQENVHINFDSFLGIAFVRTMARLKHEYDSFLGLEERDLERGMWFSDNRFYAELYLLNTTLSYSDLSTLVAVDSIGNTLTSSMNSTFIAAMTTKNVKVYETRVDGFASLLSGLDPANNDALFNAWVNDGRSIEVMPGPKEAAQALTPAAITAGTHFVNPKTGEIPHTVQEARDPLIFKVMSQALEQMMEMPALSKLYAVDPVMEKHFKIWDNKGYGISAGKLPPVIKAAEISKVDKSQMNWSGQKKLRQIETLLTYYETHPEKDYEQSNSRRQHNEFLKLMMGLRQGRAITWVRYGLEEGLIKVTKYDPRTQEIEIEMPELERQIEIMEEINSYVGAFFGRALNLNRTEDMGILSGMAGNIAKYEKVLQSKLENLKKDYTAEMDVKEKAILFGKVQMYERKIEELPFIFSYLLFAGSDQKGIEKVATDFIQSYEKTPAASRTPKQVQRYEGMKTILARLRELPADSPHFKLQAEIKKLLEEFGYEPKFNLADPDTGSKQIGFLMSWIMARMHEGWDGTADRIPVLINTLQSVRQPLPEETPETDKKERMRLVVDQINKHYRAEGEAFGINYSEIPEKLDDMDSDQMGRLISFLSEADKGWGPQVERSDFMIAAYFERFKQYPQEYEQTRKEAAEYYISLLSKDTWPFAKEGLTVENIQTNREARGSFLGYLQLKSSAEPDALKRAALKRSDKRSEVRDKEEESILNRRQFLGLGVGGGIAAALGVFASPVNAEEKPVAGNNGSSISLEPVSGQGPASADRPKQVSLNFAQLEGNNLQGLNNPTPFRPLGANLDASASISADVLKKMEMRFNDKIDRRDHLWNSYILYKAVKGEFVTEDQLDIRKPQDLKIVHDQFLGDIESNPNHWKKIDQRIAEKDFQGFFQVWAKVRVEDGWEETHDRMLQIATILLDPLKKKIVLEEVQNMTDYRLGAGARKINETTLASSAEIQGIVIGWIQFRIGFYDRDIEQSWQDTEGIADELIATLDKVQADDTARELFNKTVGKLYFLDQGFEPTEAEIKAEAEVKDLSFFKNAKDKEAMEYMMSMTAMLIVDFKKGILDPQDQLTETGRFAHHAASLWYAVTHLQEDLKAYYEGINRGDEALDPQAQEKKKRRSAMGDFSALVRMMEDIFGSYDLKNEQLAQMSEILKVQKAAQKEWRVLEDSETAYYYRLFYLNRRNGEVLEGDNQFSFSQIKNFLQIEDFFKIVQYVIQVRKDSGEKLVGKIQTEARPLWLSRAEHEAIVDFIKGNEVAGVSEGLKDVRVLEEEAVSRAIELLIKQKEMDPKDRPQLEEIKKNIFRNSQDELYLQAVYMNFHRDKDNNPIRMPRGDLSPYLEYIEMGIYTREDIAKIFKYDGMIDQKVRKLANLAISSIETDLGESISQEKKKKIQDQMFALTDSQRIGKAAFLKQRQDFGKIGSTDQDIAAYIENWIQDAAFIQAVSYVANNEYLLPFSILDSAIENFRKGRKNLTSQNRGRQEVVGYFNTTVKDQDLSYKNHGKEINQLRLLRNYYYVVYHEVLNPDQEKWWLKQWSALEEKLASKGHRQGEIEMLQQEFIEKMYTARHQLLEIIGARLYEKKPGLEKVEKEYENDFLTYSDLVSEKLISSLTDKAGRQERVQIRRDKIQAEEKILRELQEMILKDREMRKESNVDLLNNPVERETVKHGIEQDSSIPLSASDVVFLLGKMKELGYIKEEAILRFITLPRVHGKEIFDQVFALPEVKKHQETIKKDLVEALKAKGHSQDAIDKGGISLQPEEAYEIVDLVFGKSLGDDYWAQKLTGNANRRRIFEILHEELRNSELLEPQIAKALLELPRARMEEVINAVSEANWHRNRGKITALTQVIFKRWGYVDDYPDVKIDYKKLVADGLKRSDKTNIKSVEEGQEEGFKELKEKLELTKTLQELLNQYTDGKTSSRKLFGRASRISSDAIAGALNPVDLEDWNDIAIYLRNLTQRLGIEVSEREIRFRADLMLRLGVADLYEKPKSTPNQQTAIGEESEVRFRDLLVADRNSDLVKMWTNLIKGPDFQREFGSKINAQPAFQQEVLQKIIEMMLRKKMDAYDLKTLFEEAERKHQEIQTAKKELEQQGIYREIYMIIPDITFWDVLLYLDSSQHDPLKQLDLHKILFSHQATVKTKDAQGRAVSKTKEVEGLAPKELIRGQDKVERGLNGIFYVKEQTRLRKEVKLPGIPWYARIFGFDNLEENGIQKVSLAALILTLLFRMLHLKDLKNPMAGLIPDSQKGIWNNFTLARVNQFIYETLISYGRFFLLVGTLSTLFFFPHSHAILAIGIVFGLSFILSFIIALVGVSLPMVYKRALFITGLNLFILGALTVGISAMGAMALALITTYPILAAVFGLQLALLVTTSDWFKQLVNESNALVRDDEIFEDLNQKKLIQKNPQIFNPKIPPQRILKKLAMEMRPWLPGGKTHEEFMAKLREVLSGQFHSFNGNFDPNFRLVLQLNGKPFEYNKTASGNLKFTDLKETALSFGDESDPALKNMTYEKLYQAIQNTFESIIREAVEKAREQALAAGEPFDTNDKTYLKGYKDENDVFHSWNENLIIMAMPPMRKPYHAGGRMLSWLMWGEDGTLGKSWGEIEYKHKIETGEWKAEDFEPFIYYQDGNRTFWAGLPFLVEKKVAEMGGEANGHLPLYPAYTMTPFFSGIIDLTNPDRPIIPWEEAQNLSYIQALKTQAPGKSTVESWSYIDDTNSFSSGGALYLFSLIHKTADKFKNTVALFQGAIGYFPPHLGMGAQTLGSYSGLIAHMKSWFMQRIWPIVFEYIRAFGKYSGLVENTSKIFRPLPGFPLGPYTTRLVLLGDFLPLRLMAINPNGTPAITKKGDAIAALDQAKDFPNSEDELVSATVRDTNAIWGLTRKNLQSYINPNPVTKWLRQNKVTKWFVSQPPFSDLAAQNLGGTLLKQISELKEAPLPNLTNALAEMAESRPIIVDDRSPSSKPEVEEKGPKWNLNDAVTKLAKYTFRVFARTLQAKFLSDLVTFAYTADTFFVAYLVAYGFFGIQPGYIGVRYIFAAWFYTSSLLSVLILPKFAAAIFERVEHIPAIVIGAKSIYLEGPIGALLGFVSGVLYGLGMMAAIKFIALIGVTTVISSLGIPALPLLLGLGVIGAAVGWGKIPKASEQQTKGIVVFIKQFVFFPIAVIYSLLTDIPHIIAELVASGPLFMPNLIMNPSMKIGALIDSYRNLKYGGSGEKALNPTSAETETNPVWSYWFMVWPAVIFAAIAIPVIGFAVLSWSPILLGIIGMIAGGYASFVLFTTPKFKNMLDLANKVTEKTSKKPDSLKNLPIPLQTLVLFLRAVKNYPSSLFQGMKDRKILSSTNLKPDMDIKSRDWAYARFGRLVFFFALPAILLPAAGFFAPWVAFILPLNSVLIAATILFAFGISPVVHFFYGMHFEGKWEAWVKPIHWSLGALSLVGGVLMYLPGIQPYLIPLMEVFEKMPLPLASSHSGGSSTVSMFASAMNISPVFVIFHTIIFIGQILLAVVSFSASVIHTIKRLFARNNSNKIQDMVYLLFVTASSAALILGTFWAELFSLEPIEKADDISITSSAPLDSQPVPASTGFVPKGNSLFSNAIPLSPEMEVYRQQLLKSQLEYFHEGRGVIRTEYEVDGEKRNALIPLNAIDANGKPEKPTHIDPLDQGIWINILSRQEDLEEAEKYVDWLEMEQKKYGMPIFLDVDGKGQVSASGRNTVGIEDLLGRTGNFFVAEVNFTVRQLNETNEERKNRLADLAQRLDVLIELGGPIYHTMVDPKTGLFWGAFDVRTSLPEKTGPAARHKDYSNAEDGLPLRLVVKLFDLPETVVTNAAFSVKPYTDKNGNTYQVLATWDGASFQSGYMSMYAPLLSENMRTLLANTGRMFLDSADENAYFPTPAYVGEKYISNAGGPVHITPEERSKNQVPSAALMFVPFLGEDILKDLQNRKFEKPVTNPNMGGIFFETTGTPGHTLPISGPAALGAHPQLTHEALKTQLETLGATKMLEVIKGIDQSYEASLKSIEKPRSEVREPKVTAGVIAEQRDRMQLANAAASIKRMKIAEWSLGEKEEELEKLGMSLDQAIAEFSEAAVKHLAAKSQTASNRDQGEFLIVYNNEKGYGVDFITQVVKNRKDGVRIVVFVENKDDRQVRSELSKAITEGHVIIQRQQALSAYIQSKMNQEYRGTEALQFSLSGKLLNGQVIRGLSEAVMGIMLILGLGDTPVLNSVKVIKENEFLNQVLTEALSHQLTARAA